MKIVSARVGEVEFDEKDIISFSDGIIGFPSIKQYIEIDFLQDSPLCLLQAVAEPSLGFIITDPYLFLPTCDLMLPKRDRDSIIPALNRR